MAYSGGREAGAGCWNCSYSQTPQGATDPQAAMERGKQRHSAGRRVGADTSRPVCGCLSHQCRICSPGPKPIPVTLCTCALWAFPLRAQPPGPRLHQLWPLLWPRTPQVPHFPAWCPQNTGGQRCLSVPRGSGHGAQNLCEIFLCCCTSGGMPLLRPLKETDTGPGEPGT